MILLMCDRENRGQGRINYWNRVWVWDFWREGFGTAAKEIGYYFAVDAGIYSYIWKADDIGAVWRKQNEQ